ncbi:hypothetical protein [Clostridium sporogenes]|uniref:hypothetical protein n=1 Tax=Clostridium sporogenes TaxID=1509 RepID=UPI001F30368C|nr:hypothetical protein [Clostridium sporogenes]UJA30855.1 hypothetical protein L0894_12100 [Clostridium sporogenes]
MEKSGFFNSINGDRKYKADFFAEFFASFIGNGVYPNPSTSLQVLSNNDMTVTIKQGRAWINGRYYNNDSDLVLSLDIADGVLDRIDRIVIRKDTVKRKTYAYIKKGYFASSPPAPTLQRDADAYELGIADIYVKAGTISITQADITDLRLNKDLCGIVHGVVEQVDTTTLFNQYTERFKIKSEEFEKEFEDWLKTLKDVLDEDTAGNLLNLITKNEGNINNIKSELADITTKQNDNNEQINESIDNIRKELESYNYYAYNKDGEGIFTIVDYKRNDNTLYMKSTLSNPNSNGNYQTNTWNFYNDTGSKIIKTIIWTINYDEEGDIISEVIK